MTGTYIYPKYKALTLRAMQDGENVEDRYKSGIKSPHSRQI